MSERVLIKRVNFDHEHEATIWGYADHGSDHQAVFEVEIVAMNSDHYDLYCAGQDIDHAIEAMAAGAADYITKPISPPIVKARVRIHIQNYLSKKFLENLLSSKTTTLEDAKEGAKSLLVFV
jgi:response regulator RpfG family c-di-GMP phosphodiesterase